MKRSPSDGFTLIELLIAGAVMIVVLVVASTFFVQQARVSERTQAGTDLRDRLRLSMHLLTNDLVLSGSGRYIGDGSNGVADGQSASLAAVAVADDPSTPQVGVPAIPFPLCGTSNATLGTSGTYDFADACLQVDSQDPTAFAFTTTYVNSLRSLDTSCREVMYQIVAGTSELRREEQFCGEVPNVVDVTTLGTSPLPDSAVLVPDIVGVDVQLQCLQPPSPDPAVDMFTESTGTTCEPRSALVSVIGRTRMRGATGPTTLSVPGAKSVTCPAGFRCAMLQEEVVLPNLRGQDQ